MIPIKINKQKINIPSYEELTVKQYRDVINSTVEGDMDIVKYLCIVQGYDYVKAQDFKIKGLDSINVRLGEFKIIRADQPPIKEATYIEDDKPKKYVRVDHGKENYEYFDLSNIQIETAGHRLLIEQELKNKATWLDLYSFSIAMLMVNLKYKDNTKRYDYELIKKYQGLIENENAYDTLCLGGFFLRNIMNGEKGVRRFLRNWIFRLLTRTSTLKSKPELIS